MARPARPTYGGHPYSPGLVTWASPGGRTYVLCATCDRGANHPMHHANAIPGPAPETARRPKAVRPRKDARTVHRPASRPMEPVLAALVAILDIVRAAELLPMAAHVHAVALRAILAEGEGRRLTPQEPAEEAPAPVELRVVGRSHQAPVDSTVARARQATKGIRNERVRALATRAIAAGWSPRRDSRDHLRLERAGHPPIVLSMTAGDDARSWANARAAARRKGLDTAGL